MTTRPHTRRSSAPPTPPRALYVDDERHVQQAFARTAREAGLVVDVAANATQALRRVESATYAVVAVDLSMPGLDGLGLVERLREMTPRSAFVLVSASPKLELPAREGVQLDAFVVGKPWNTLALHQTLQHAIERSYELALRPSSDPIDSVTARFLIVDAHDWRAESTERALDSAGLAELPPERVTSLRAALDLLDEEPFDVVLVDITRPETGGFEAISRLRLATPEAAVIALADYWDDVTARHAMRLGAEDCLEHCRPDTDLAALRRRVLLAHERKCFERRAGYLSRYDHLTGLPNRATFLDRLGHALARYRREGDALAVMFVDLDRFKVVNERFGHDAGDRFLREVAHRLQLCLREGDTLARIGGDEFAIVVEGPVSREGVADIARRVRETMGEPFVLGEGSIVPRASIGGAICPDAGDTVEALLAAADSAMFGGKREGGNRFAMAGQVSDTAALTRLRQEGQLRYALERQQFQLEYQPQWSVREGRVIGLEALIRWRTVGGAIVPPYEFVPLLESLGMIVPVGVWVIDTACAQLAAFCAAGIEGLRMAVNLSPLQLEDPGLLDVLEGAVSRHGIAARDLELEITETTLLRTSARSKRVLSELRHRGFRIALDDFGTGHSSLAHLATFEVDTLKIDRSFVLVDAPRNLAIVTSIVELARRLGLEVVAEGVETVEQRDALRAAGCDVLQGFLLGRPVAPERLNLGSESTGPGLEPAR